MCLSLITFNTKKYAYLIGLVYCYAMFKFCQFVNNVQNGHHRTSNICNNITCIEVIAALENSSQESCTIIPGRIHSSVTRVNYSFNVVYVCRDICMLILERNLPNVTHVD